MDVLWTLALSGSVSLAASLAFAYAGVHFARRSRHDGSHGATIGFALWWFAFGAYTAMGGVESLLGSVGAATFPLILALRYASLPILCVGLAGVAYYILYVRTGDPRWAYVVSAYFAGLAVAFVVNVAVHGPLGVDIQRWRTDITYATPIAGWPLTVLLLLVVVPEAAAAIAYLTLYRRAKEPVARYRILIVGVSLLVWLAAGFLSRVSQDDFAQLIARPILGALMAGAILAAYRPPDWVRRRLQGEPAEARAAALQVRIRSLI